MRPDLGSFWWNVSFMNGLYKSIMIVSMVLLISLFAIEETTGNLIASLNAADLIAFHSVTSVLVASLIDLETLIVA